MTWRAVRGLSMQEGFEIGSHTCSHVDLGVIPIDEGERELFESRKQLERELDMPIRLFAFPYGHRAQHAARCDDGRRPPGVRDLLFGLRRAQHGRRSIQPTFVAS